MKKVTNITLGGMLFAIEEDAYDALSVYLKSFEKKFADSPDYEEIASDIESAMAEKFRSKRKKDKEPIRLTDVEEAIGEMGTAEEVDEDGATDKTNAEQNEPVPSEGVAKRLYRDVDDAILGGVASGIARYFDIDPVIVRVLFVIGAFINGLGALIYLIFWFIVPPALSATQKYAMQGKKMTISDITERVKKNLNDLNAGKNFDVGGSWGRVRSILDRLFRMLGRVVYVLSHILRFVIALSLIVGGAVGIAFIASAISVFWIADMHTLFPEIASLMAVLFTDTGSYVLLFVFLILIFIPCVVLIMIGSSLLLKRNIITLSKGLVLFVTWLVAVMLVVSLGFLYGPVVVQELREHEPGVFRTWIEGGAYQNDARGGWDADWEENWDKGSDADVNDFPREGATSTEPESPRVVFPPRNTPPDEPVACTMEAKVCPDGSYVGRVGPTCEFAPCP